MLQAQARAGKTFQNPKLGVAAQEGELSCMGQLPLKA